MSSYNNAHILYGNYGLSNRRISVTDNSIFTTSNNNLQTIELARTTGARVVFKRNSSKQVNLEGGVTFLGTGEADEVQRTKEQVDKIFSFDDRWLRFTPKTKLTVIDDCQAVTGWTASDDATSVTLDSEDFQWEDSSISFTVDVSNSGNNYATMTKTLSPAIDLSSYTDSGSFEFWVYIEDVFYVSSIDFRIGNDSSNYYSGSLTSNYEGKPLENGWNYLSAQWGNSVQGKTIDETGTVTDSDLDYLYTRINYTSDATDFTARLGGFFHIQEDWDYNYPCYRTGEIGYDSSWYLLTDLVPQNFSVNLLNYTGYGLNTHPIQLFNVTGITTTTNTQTVDLGGTFTPLLRNQFTLNTVTNLSDLRYFNLSTNENIRWTNAWAADDVVVFDGGSLGQPLVTRNGEPQDFEGKLPENQTGKNRLQMRVVTTANVKITQDSFNSSDDFKGADLMGSDSKFLAQSWTCTQTGTLTRVKVRIEADFFGDLAITNDFSGDAGNASQNLQKVSFSATSGPEIVELDFNVPVTSGTTYWIKIAGRPASVFGGTPRTIGKWYEDTTQPYAGGLGKSSPDQSTWTSTSSDFYFEVVQEPTPSTDIDWSCSYRKLYY
jgi:hypothetical protein